MINYFGKPLGQGIKDADEAHLDLYIQIYPASPKKGVAKHVCNHSNRRKTA